MAVFRIDHIPDLSMSKYRRSYPDGGFDLASGSLSTVAKMSPRDTADEIGIRSVINPAAGVFEAVTSMYVSFDRNSGKPEDLRAALSSVDSFFGLSRVEGAVPSLEEGCFIFLLRWKDELVAQPKVIATYAPVIPEKPTIGAADHAGYVDWFMKQARGQALVDSIVRRKTNDEQLNAALTENLREVGLVASAFSPDSPRKGSIEDLWRYRDPVAGRHLKMLEKKLELAVSGNGFEFMVRVAAIHEDDGWALANALANVIGTSATMEIVVLRQGCEGYFEALAALGTMSFHPESFFPPSRALESEMFRKIEEDRPSRAERIQTLSRSCVLCSSDEVDAILRLPVSKGQKPKTMFLETEFGRFAPVKKNGLSLGRDLERDWPVNVPLDLLPRHLSIFGSPGTGKTMTVLKILSELEAPFLIVEPRKGEYRRLLGKESEGRRIRVLTPGNERMSPLRFNPLEVPEGITVGEHSSAVSDALLASLPTSGPIGPIMRELVERAYEGKGLEADLFGRECPRFPTLFDLQRLVPKIMDEKQYSRETGSDVHGALATRIGALTGGQHGRVFDCERSIPSLKSYIEDRIILELQGLAGEARGLFTLLLLTSTEGHLRGIGPSSILRTMMVIEEAHNLLGSRGKGGRSEEGDPQGSATDLIVRMLAELRAYGLGICVVDQTPAAISPMVRKNTGIKITHRPTDAEDAELLAGDLNLPPSQATEIQRLDRGEAYIYHERLYSAVHVKIEAVPGLENDLTDSELSDLLRESQWFGKHLLAIIASDLEVATRRLESDLLDAVENQGSTIAETVEKAMRSMTKVVDRLTGLGAPADPAARFLASRRDRVRKMVEVVVESLESRSGEKASSNP